MDLEKVPNYYTAKDIMAILGISKTNAYKIIRQLNDELMKMGYLVVSGKVSRKFFNEKFYGMS